MLTAQAHIPRGVSSGARTRLAPLVFDSAAGSRLHTIDGAELVDAVLGIGPVLLGHTHPHVAGAVSSQAHRAHIVAGQTELEPELAARLTQIIPCAEYVLFSTTGTEAVQTAINIARGSTGRHKIAKFLGHYHGWMPPGNVMAAYATPTVLHQGCYTEIPQVVSDQVVVGRWNDLDKLDELMERQGPDLAALIMEVVPLNGAFAPSPGLLDRARVLCSQYGVVLIFDEVVTGFRLALGGAQQRFGVTPDMSVHAKAIAGGFPVAATVGSAWAMQSVLDGRVAPAGTYNASPVGLAAAIAMTGQLLEAGSAFYDELDRLGARMSGAISDIAQRRGVPLCVSQVGSMLQLGWSEHPVSRCEDLCRSNHTTLNLVCEAAALFGAYVHPRGVLLLSGAHTDDDIDQIAAAIDAAIAHLLQPLGSPTGRAHASKRRLK